MVTDVMMKCGHAAQGVSMKSNSPVCVVCFGINDGADEVDVTPDLTGRIALCMECNNGHKGKYQHKGDGCPKPSSVSLPFFKVTLNHEFDDYYCGCWGWD